MQGQGGQAPQLLPEPPVPPREQQPGGEHQHQPRGGGAGARACAAEAERGVRGPRPRGWGTHRQGDQAEVPHHPDDILQVLRTGINDNSLVKIGF